MPRTNIPSLPPHATENEIRQAMLIDERKRLTGIGGWLATFIVLYALGWFFGLGLIFGLAMDAGFTFAMLIIVVLDWTGRIAVLAGLLSASRSGSRAIRMGLGTQLACMIIQSIVTIMSLRMDAGAFLALLCILAYHIAWLTYFSKSLRVKYTYDDRAWGRHSEVF
ncbi:hypothetical protein LJC48_07595 [Desulfovibrio sp. OttesenSCG-928-C06]|nr:hypothetical protein [Desulfovibrio sp. OttesenSCG-928-C06]